MEIGEIKTITRHYRSSKGNEYQIVRIELIDIPADMRYLYDEAMYGTINYKYITDGRLNTPLERRKDFEECEGMGIEELIEYFKTKNIES